MATRNTLVAANSQQRPEERWFVIGEPSSGILMLKFWVSAIMADRWVRIALGSFELKADRAKRF